jgi:DNA-directed RNA polymerase specialized sigma24 family protein
MESDLGKAMETSLIIHLADLVGPVCHAQGRHFQAKPELVEEVCDAVLERVLDSRHAHRLTGEELERYVRRTAWREAREFFRQETSRRSRSGRLWLPLDDSLAARTNGPLQQLIQDEERVGVARAWRTLTPQQREALATFRGDNGGPTVKGLAQRWGWDPKRVYYFRTKALRVLAMQMRKEGLHDDD